MDLTVIENDPIEVKKYLENFVPTNYYQVLGDGYLYQVRAVLLHSVSQADLFNPKYDAMFNDLSIAVAGNTARIANDYEVWADLFSAGARRTDILEVSAANANAAILEIRQATASQNQAQASINTQLKASLDDIVVGGRNLIINSTFAKGYDIWGQPTVEVIDHYIGKMHKLISNGTGNMGIRPLPAYKTVKLVEGRQYSLSFYGFGSVLLLNRVYLVGATGTLTRLPDIVMSTDLSERRHITFTAPIGGNDIGFIIGAGSVPAGEWFTIAQLKLELGNKPTDWTPAPEDVDGYIAQVQSSIDEFKEVQVTRNEATALAIQTLDSRVKDNAAQIVTERQTRATQYDALAKTTSELNTATGENKASITEINTTFTNRYEAAANRLVELEAATSLGAGKIETLEEVTANNTQVIASTNTNLSAKIDGVAIGGRNLLRNADFKLGYKLWGKAAATESETILGNLLTVSNMGTVNDYFGIEPLDKFQTINIMEGKPYVLSFYAEGDIPALNDVWIRCPGHDSLKLEDVKLTTSLGLRTELVFTAPFTASKCSFIIGAHGVPVNSWFGIVAVKFEQGNKATDWTVAPEDTREIIQAVEANINDFKKVQVEANLALAQTVSSMSTSIGNNSASITTMNIALVDTNKSITTTKNEIMSEFNTNKASVNATLSTLTTKSNAAVTDINSLKTKTDNTNAEIVTVKSLISTNTSSIASVKTNLEAQFNGLVIGGRNLLLASKIETYGSATLQNGVGNLSYANGRNAWLRFRIDDLIRVEPNSVYVFSFKVKKISGTLTTIGGHIDSGKALSVKRDNVTVSENTSSWGDSNYPNDIVTHSYEIVFNIIEAQGWVYIQPSRLNNYADTGIVKVWDMQVEKGNKSSDFQPAIEDIKLESDAAIFNEATARAAGDEAITRSVNTLKSDYDSNKSSITNSLSTLSNKDIALTNSINSLTSTVGNNTTAITSEATTRANADSALSTRITTNLSKADNALSRITTAETTIASNTQSIASTRTELKADFDGIKVGGRNLLGNSDTTVVNSLYMMKEYSILDSLVAGEVFTCTIWGELNSAKSNFAIYNSGGNGGWNVYELSAGVYQVVGTWRVYGANNFLRVYQFPNSVNNVESKIFRIKLERGNKGTDWSPASEDLTTSIGITNAAISNEAITRANADGALSSRITTAQSKADSAFGKITTAENTIANNTQAIATAENSLTAKFNNAIEDGELGGLYRKDDTVSGYDSSGAITNAAGYHKIMKNLVSITGQNPLISEMWNPKLLSGGGSNRIAFFDVNKNWISSVTNLNLSAVAYRRITINVPSNARYARIGVIAGVSTAGDVDDSIVNKVTESNFIVDAVNQSAADIARVDQVSSSNKSAIASTTTTLRAEINTAVGSVEVGGRNLVRKGEYAIYGYVSASDNGKVVITDTLTANQDFMTDYIKVTKGDKYVASVFPITGNESINTLTYIHEFNNSKGWTGYKNYSGSAGATNISKYVASNDGYIICVFRGYNEYNHKFEKGSIGTDWTPAPEDTLTSPNLFSVADCTSGYERTGEIVVANSSHQIMKSLVAIDGRKDIYLQCWNPNKLNVNGNNRIAWFTSSKTYISSTASIPNLNGSKYYVVAHRPPSNAKFMRIGVIAGNGAIDPDVLIKVEENNPTIWSPAPRALVDAYSTIEEEKITRADGDSALSSRLDTTNSKVGSNTSAIQQEVTARTNAVSSVASSVTSLKTTVDGHTSSITSQANSLNGLSANWSFQLNVNGKVSGIYQYSTGKVSSMEIITDNFKLGPASGNSVAPFRQEGTVTYLQEAMIKTLHGNKIIANTITTREIAAKSITAASGIIADLAVDTLQIAGNAVTIPRVQNFSESIYVAASDATTGYSFGNLTMDVQGGSVTIQTMLSLMGVIRTSGAAIGGNIHIDTMRGTTRVARFSVPFQNDRVYQLVTTPVAIDSPPTGNQTYSIRIWVQSTGDAQLYFTGTRSIHVMGVKR